MREPVSAERWAALRGLREGLAPTFARLATAADLSASTLREHANRENWAKRDLRRSTAGAGETQGADGPLPRLSEQEMSLLATPLDRPAELASFLLTQVGGLLTDARHGRIDKARIDAVWSMVRLVEKSQLLAVDGIKEQKKRSDDELAGLLERLDDRIVELAEHHAKRLVEPQPDAG